MPDLEIDPASSALVLLDLQGLTTRLPLTPRTADDVLATAGTLTTAARGKGLPVIWVRTRFADDRGDWQPVVADRPGSLPRELPAGWDEVPADLRRDTDIVVTKRQWSAFYGSDLELQLRRRGITTMITGGIATNYVVESTVRVAWELGLRVVVVTDLCTGLDATDHEFAMTRIFPQISQVAPSKDVLSALGTNAFLAGLQ